MPRRHEDGGAVFLERMPVPKYWLSQWPLSVAKPANQNAAVPEAMRFTLASSAQKGRATSRLAGRRPRAKAPEFGRFGQI